MKTNIIAISALSIAMLFSSCNNKSEEPTNPISGENGELALSVDANKEYITVISKGSKAEDELDVNKFKVVLKTTDGKLVKSWDKYSEVEEAISLEEGRYLIESFNSELAVAEFDAPYFYGSKEVRVIAQTMQNIALECKLSNIKLSVNFTDKFKEFIKDAMVSVMNNEDGGVLNWTVSETRAGFFRVPEVSKRLVVTVKGTNIKTGATLKAQAINLDNVAPQQWHRITVDVITTGNATHEFTLNTELIEKDITIEIPDEDDVIDNNGDQGGWDDPSEPENPGEPENPEEPVVKPTIIGSNFNGTPFNIKEPVVISAANALTTQLDVLFTSTVGIDNLILTITSENPMLASMFPEDIDLANPDTSADYYAIFADPSVGIINPDAPIKGKKSHTFSVGGLMSMLAELGTDTTHSFGVKVVDANGEISEILRIKVVE